MRRIAVSGARLTSRGPGRISRPTLAAARKCGFFRGFSPNRVIPGNGRSQIAGGVAQLVRAPACHAGGRGFEPRRSRQFREARSGLSGYWPASSLDRSRTRMLARSQNESACVARSQGEGDVREIGDRADACGLDCADVHAPSRALGGATCAPPGHTHTHEQSRGSSRVLPGAVQSLGFFWCAGPPKGGRYSRRTGAGAPSAEQDGSFARRVDRI